MAGKDSKRQSVGDSLRNILEYVLKIKKYDGQVFLLYGRKSGVGTQMKEYDPINKRIYIAVLLLSAFGAIIQYSASNYMCATSKLYRYDSMYMLKRQLVYIAASFVIMWLAEHFNYQVLLSRLGVLIYLASVGSIGLLTTKLGVNVNGATRWLNLRVFQFAPSEVVKVSVVIVLAMYASCRVKNLGKLTITVHLWALGGVPALLLLKVANDLSSALVVLMITFAITLVVTRTYRTHFVVMAVVILGASLWVYSLAIDMPTTEELLQMPFRETRIIAWLAPEDYYSTRGWQIANTLYAVGSGGILGNGLGSFQRLKNLVPYAYTDVIFSVVIYELGIVGGIVLLGLYMYLVYQLIRVCINSEDMFGFILCVGYIAHICIQVALHVAVVLNLMPNTGQTLPWVSYSGTAFLCLGAEIGLVLSVTRLHVSHFAKSELFIPIEEIKGR